MKSGLTKTVLGAVLILTSLCAVAAENANISVPDGVYKCALNPDNMIGLAPEYTVFIQNSRVVVHLATLAIGGYQIEQARTHENESATFTKVSATNFKFEARMYSPETAQFLYNENYMLDTQKKELNVSRSGYTIPIPCEKVF